MSALYKYISKLILKGLGFVIAMTMGAVAVYAQSGIMSTGDAAVTGFSGTIKPTTDNTLFDINGPSLRIITLPGSGAYGFINTLKP